MFHPTLKIKIYQEDLVFGPGLVILMEHILVTESMKDACGEMGMSYSKGWKIVKDAQKQLGFPLLNTKSGGAEGGFSQLTPQCREFLKNYLDMEAELAAESRKLFEKYFGRGTDS